MEVKELKTLVKLVKGKKPKSLSETKTKTHSEPYLLAKVIRGSEKPKFGKEDEMVVVSSADLVIISDGDAGEVFQGLNGGLASTMSKIELLENINLKYLKYFLISNRKLFSDTRTGAAIPHLNKDVFFNLQIPVPSLQEQEKIVERLDKLEKRNTELYKIYKEQLLDLKNLSEEYLNKSFSKMNKNLTPLQLSTINITDGSHNPAKGVDKSNYMMLSSKNVIDDELNFENPRYLKKEDFLLENKRTNLEVNDVLLTIVGTIGRTAVVKNLEHNITFQRSVCVIKPNKKILNSYYLKYFLDSIKSFLEKNARGVAQKGIYLNQIREINIPLMDLDRQVQLITEIEKVQNLIKEITKKKNEQILKQEQLKKSILNKEFSYE